MEGSAMGWVRWVLRKSPTIPWAQFCSDLLDRFGDDSTINAYEARYTMRQMGDLEEYTSLFEARVVQLPEFLEAQYVGMFLGGLKKHIRDQIPDSAITDVHSAIRAMRKIARSSRPPDHSSWMGGAGHPPKAIGDQRPNPKGRGTSTQSGSYTAQVVPVCDPATHQSGNRTAASSPSPRELSATHSVSGGCGNSNFRHLSNEGTIFAMEDHSGRYIVAH